ncbi:MAG: sigma factor [Pirellulales bacterium]
MTESKEHDNNHWQTLQHISTHWTAIENPARFVTRYGSAVRAYLRALLPSRDDADEVEQEFLLQVVAQGFPTAAPGRGHFRHYLIAIVRNAAWSHLRRQNRRPSLTPDLSHIAEESRADDEWQRTWRECVLRSAWNALRDHQKRVRGNLCHTVLKAYVDYPQEDSVTLAERVTRSTKQPLTAEAFRKQLSRARRRFAELLVEEVARTISNVTPELLDEELRELDLLKYVEAHRPLADER